MSYARIRGSEEYAKPLRAAPIGGPVVSPSWTSARSRNARAPAVPLRKERDLCYPQIPKGEAPDHPGNTEKDQGPRNVGATGFEPATTCTPSGETTIPTGAIPSQALAITGQRTSSSVQPSQRIAGFSRNFAANLLPDFSGGVEQLITVRQVAKLVGVCSATVYKWAALGVLPHVRIVNVIRVRREDLNRLLSGQVVTLPAPPRPSQ